MYSRQRHLLRNQSGSITGTFDVLIVIPLIIIGIVCVINSCVVGFYKQKLTFITTQAASYAANLPPNVEPTKPTEKLVAALVKRCELSGVNLKVAIKNIEIEDQDAVAVTVTGNFSLLHLQGIPTPMGVSMSDSSTALIPANRVCAAIAISPYPYSCNDPDSKISVYVPIIQPRNHLQVWEFPRESSVNALHNVGDQPPAAPQPNRKDCPLPRPSLY